MCVSRLYSPTDMNYGEETGGHNKGEALKNEF